MGGVDTALLIELGLLFNGHLVANVSPAERGFSLSSMAFGAALPFVCAMAGSNFFGAAIDRLGQSQDRTLVRKWFLLPFLFSALLLLAVPVVASPVGLVATLCAAMFLLTLGDADLCQQRA